MADSTDSQITLLICDDHKLLTDSLATVVNAEPDLLQRDDEAQLQKLIASHARLTGSRHAQTVLRLWEQYAPLFWKVAPPVGMVERSTARAQPAVAPRE